MLEQLPHSVQDQLISGYLYKPFLQKFTDFFLFKKPPTSLLSKANYYTWHDQDYRDFMYQLITQLEPFREKGYTVLKEELDEFNEIMYVNKGKVVIGYEINKEKRYCIQYTDKVVIGAYGITFN